MQAEMNLPNLKSEDVTDEVLKSRLDMKAAIRLCVEVSPRERKVIAYELEIDEGQLSRMLNNGANFPPEKIIQLMDVCGNEIPLRWLALAQGYGLYRLKNAVELENESLKKALDEKEKEIEVIKKFMKETK